MGRSCLCAGVGVFKERSADCGFQEGVQVTQVGYMPVDYC